MTFRYSVVTGAVGFIGGVLFKERKLLNNSLLNAAGDVPLIETEFKTVISKFGFRDCNTFQCKSSYILSYDNKNRVPLWVMEHLTPDNVKENNDVILSKRDFFEDDSIDDYFRSRNEDYLGSGFSRGHLAAAMNHRSNKENHKNTFVYSNMTPQKEAFNTGIWEKLENHALDKVKLHDNVYVCTGPLYLPSPRKDDGKLFVNYQVIGPNKVAVPTHFFKIIVCERKNKKCKTNENKTYEMETYLMPHDAIDKSLPLEKFLCSKEEVEKSSGLRLFHKLPKSQLYKINGIRNICDS